MDKHPAPEPLANPSPEEPAATRGRRLARSFAPEETLGFAGGEDAAWRTLREAVARRDKIWVTPLGYDSEGMRVDAMGIPGLLPTGVIGPIQGSRSDLIGKPLQVAVVAAEREAGRLVLSRSFTLRAQREIAMARQAPDGVVDGVVTWVEPTHAKIRLSAFGSLVRGIVESPRVAWGGVDDATKSLRVGDPVRARVSRFDAEKGLALLDMRDPARDPWLTAAEDVRLGEPLEAKVIQALHYGVFLRLPSGLSGLAHRSCIGGLPEMESLSESTLFRPGDKVVCRATAVDPASRKISFEFSMAELYPSDNPEPDYRARILARREAQASRFAKPDAAPHTGGPGA